MSETTILQAGDYLAAADAVKRAAQQFAHMQRAAAALETIGALANTKAELEAEIAKRRDEVARLEAVVVSATEEADKAKGKAAAVLADAAAEGQRELAAAKARALALVEDAQARAATTVADAKRQADSVTIASAEKLAEIQRESAEVRKTLAEEAKELAALRKEAAEARDLVARAEKIRSAMQ